MAEETTTTEETKETTEEVKEISEETKEETSAEKEDSTADWLKELGLTDISEEDLQGIEEEEKEPEPEETKEKETEEETTEDVETETPPPKVDTPPKGFVPTKAVQEAREENRYLKEQIKALEDKIDNLAKKTEKPPEEEEEPFNVLSKSELLELSADDPPAAIAYMLELQEYKEKQAEKAKAESEKLTARQQATSLFNETAKIMEEAVPGLFDEKSGKQQELVSFAESVGFTDDLFFLTNPETMIVMPGETVPKYLGKQAAGIVKFIAGLKERLNTTDTKSLEKRIRTEIESEIMKKIKTSGKTFKSLTDIPTSETDSPKPKRLLSESEMAKMSDKDIQKYLSEE